MLEFKHWIIVILTILIMAIASWSYAPKLEDPVLEGKYKAMTIIGLAIMLGILLIDKTGVF